jgi:hypothetical protein
MARFSSFGSSGVLPIIKGDRYIAVGHGANEVTVHLHPLQNTNRKEWMSRVPLVLPLLLIGFRSIPFQFCCCFSFFLSAAVLR